MIATILMQPAAGGGGIAGFLPMILIVIVFYFFMIRPQMKKQKDQKKYVDELKKGDWVITNSGIHGKIYEVGETTFLVEVDNGVRIKFDKAAISLDASKALNTPVTVTKA
jgi:preprotein translocase subunit YajC